MRISRLKKVHRIILLSSVAFVNIGCDQISKDIVREEIAENQVISIVQNNFTLTRVENTGAALSLGADLPPALKILLLQVLPVIVLLFLFGMILTRTQLPRVAGLGLAFIVGGGVGNIYDRILYGSVTDFMHMKIGVVETAIFNMADVSIVVGTTLILMHAVFDKKNSIKASL